MKNNFWAVALTPLAKNKKENLTGKGKFFTELRDSFIRDRDEAIKKQWEIQEGKDAGKLAKTKGVVSIVGNVAKYGRIVADVTGASIANPFRYVMMSGMAAGRMAEAGKETRFKNAKLIEKTRIQDAEKAAEEAWKIYERAGGKIDESGNISGASVEDISKAYLASMPEDLKKRLESPKVALNFVQKALIKNIDIRISRLNKKIEEIENSVGGSNFDAWQKIEKEKLLKKWGKELKDYDRVLDQYGAVDQIAMGARYAQVISKAVVVGMQIETIAVSLPHLLHGLHIISSHHDTTNHHTESIDLKIQPHHTPEIPKDYATNPAYSAHDILNEPDSALVNNFPETHITIDHGHGLIWGIRHAQEDYLKHLQANHIDPSKAPAWTHEDPTKLARDLGGYDPNATDGKESLLVGNGSILNIDAHGQLSLHDALTGKDNILIHGDTFQEEQIHGTMFHSEFGQAGGEHVAGPAHSLTESSVGQTPEGISHLGPTKIESDLNALHASDMHREHAEQLAKIQENIRQKMATMEAHKPKTNTTPGPGHTNPAGENSHSDLKTTEIYKHTTMGHGHMPIFPDITPEQNEYLSHYPEIVGNNSFHLSGVKLLEVCEASQKDRTFLFGNQSASLWEGLSKLKAGTVLEHASSVRNVPGSDGLSKYLEVLRNFSKIKPGKGLFGIGGEKTGQYMGRALQKLAYEGKLRDFEESIRK